MHPRSTRGTESGTLLVAALGLLSASALFAACSGEASRRVQDVALASGCLRDQVDGGSENLTTSLTDGPFTFVLGLYEDGALKLPSQAGRPSSASDIEGVGWTDVWTYAGPDAGPVNEVFGPLDSLVEEAPFFAASITSGATNGHPAGGLTVGTEVKDGDRVAEGVRVELKGKSYAAIISFTVRRDANGLAACDVHAKAGWPLDRN